VIAVGCGVMCDCSVLCGVMCRQPRQSSEWVIASSWKPTHQPRRSSEWVITVGCGVMCDCSGLCGVMCRQPRRSSEWVIAVGCVVWCVGSQDEAVSG